MAKKYNLGGGLSLHDARRIMGVSVIAHTGKVNSYARCMGTKIKAAGLSSVSAARDFMKKHASECKGA